MSHIKRTHQFFAASNAILGVSRMARLYNKKIRQIYTYAADPDFCEYVGRNPLDLLRINMQLLCEAGRQDVAEAGLRLLAEPLGYEVKLKDIESKNNAQLELMDCVEAVGQLSQVLREIVADGQIDNDEKALFTELVDRAIKELRELKDAVRKERI